MTIGEFIFDRLGRMVFQTACSLAAAAFLRATGTGTGVIVLLWIIWLSVYLGTQAYDFWHAKTHLSEMDAIMQALEQRYLFMECAPKPQSLYERKLLGLLRLSGKDMVQAVSNAEAARREYREYVEQWVHEIKTPITAAKLVCRNLDSDLRRKLLQELAQIDAHVERALFYARAESPEKDFIIREAYVSEICEQAIQAHRTLLIQNGVRVETEGLELSVYTDSKWAAFLLGQLLQNAARYHSKEPVITLSARNLGNQVQLAVEDNGIGIPIHELPRVFDRSFTGSNGRKRGGSTGMGLYLCKRMADLLQIEIQIRSAQGEGTCVTLTFPAKESLTPQTFA